mgnify:CR=1 FL=1
MTIKKLYIPLVCFGLAAILFSCEDADDFNNVIEQVTCTDGIQNGEETGIDCGGECGPWGGWENKHTSWTAWQTSCGAGGGGGGKSSGDIPSWSVLDF